MPNMPSATPVVDTKNSSDPSALTTQSVLRENFWLRELLETRINAMDEAVRLLQTFAARTPTTMDVQYQTIALREVVMEKIDGIKTQLLERDTQTEKASRDVKSAVDAAFAAAKEAVGEQNKSNALSIDKSEKAVTKQIDGMIDNTKSSIKGLDDKISDIKDRITSIESKTSVSDPTTAIDVAALKASVSRLSSSTDIMNGRGAGAAALWGLIVGGLGLLFGLGSFVGLMMKFAK